MVHQPRPQRAAGGGVSGDLTARRRTPLAQTLAADIARDGPLPVADFMARCLWNESHGYYATRQPLGRAGDFITAPEISQTFGELIGLWAAVVWRDQMAAPLTVTLAELGPGRGTLMRDMLRATAKVPRLHAALRCHLIEASQPLIDQQRATLAGSGVPVAWAREATSIAAPAIVIANEFFDALPVDQWIKTPAGWAERCVTVDAGGNLAFDAMPGRRLGQALLRDPTSAGGAGPLGRAALDPTFEHLDDDLPKAPEDTIIERRRFANVIEYLGALAAAGPVAALIIDYGHESSGPGDTLQAVRNHAHEHPLTSPGEADLSAQVDFAELARAAERAGFVVDGPVTQAAFLGRLGIVERASKLMAANPTKAAEIEFGVARLIAPDGMGSRFKVLGLRAPSLPPLPGFEVHVRDRQP
jgi:NADH dehydrogenase [ubiquinone] 1 alpha subcomplex assembly factor 7